MELIRIEDPSDPCVVGYMNVRDAHLRQMRTDEAGTPMSEREGVFVAEGDVVVQQLARSAYEPVSVLVVDRRIETARPTLEALAGRGAAVYVASQEVMDAVTGFHIHRGLLAIGQRGQGRTIEQIAQQPGPIVVLEELANTDNVGAMFRNAAAFGAGGVVLTSGCADPLYRRSLRVSTGHALIVPWTRGGSVGEVLGAIKGAGRLVVVLEAMAEATALSAFVRRGVNPDRVALLLGTEGPGVSQAAMQLADEVVRVEMAECIKAQPDEQREKGGRGGSVNVAVAGAVALHALFVGRQG